MDKNNKKTGKNKNLSERLFVLFNTLFIIFLSVCVLVPLIKTLSISLTNTYQYMMSLNFFKEIDIRTYKFLMGLGSFEEFVDFRSALIVSLFTTFMTAVIGLFVSCIGAYILTQKEMPGAKILGRLMLFAAVFNGGIIPRFLVMHRLGLINSLWVVILPMCFNFASILFLKVYFESLPKDMLDAAEMDGCSPVGKFFKIVLPLSKAPLSAVGLFFAAAAWNEYIGYVLYISDVSKRNLQYLLREWFFSFDGINRTASWYNVNPAAAGAANVVILIIPAILASIVTVNFIVPLVTGMIKKRACIDS